MAQRPKENWRSPPGPGFAAKYPLFPAVAQIDKTLGKTGQFILVNELAIRELNLVAQNSSTGIEAHMKSVATRHGINVSLSEFTEVSTELPRWYTVLVFTAVDRIFRLLIKDIRKYKQLPSWTTHGIKRPLSALEQLAANQPSGQKRLDKYVEFQVLQYYRLLRNEIVHPPRGSNRPAVSAHEALTDTTLAYLKSNYQTRGAPNLPSAITFDDFFLHVRAAREFAMVISDAYQLTVDEILHIDGASAALVRKARNAGGGRERDFRNFFYDHYFKRYQRWNDAAAIAHANNFADQALRVLR
ncbi:hypothetical protein [Lysobacter antibioticus]|jgi:hypothetical protein|uniref:hypothetical protein n=1 Tax=Lysobacter antibioticus TaxID=84531 RepID=UPI000716F153|nr:hypothetical protein [Lysobacter antibioticus]